MIAFPVGVALAAVETQQAPACAGHTHRCRCRRPDRSARSHRVEGTSACMLSGGTGARQCLLAGTSARPGDTVCTWPALQRFCCRPDGGLLAVVGSWTCA
jgi:hypothetical protein